MRILTLFILSHFLLACSEQKAPVVKIPEVFVVTATEQPYHPSRTYNARVQSSNDVEIKAEVRGKLVAVLFDEGDQVKKGDLLFKVDPKPYSAELSRANSELKKLITDLEIAQKNYDRGREIVEKGYISELDFDNLKAKKLKAESEIESAQALVDTAQINLDNTLIKAPIDGRIGRAIPSVGDLVGPEQEPLTTLVGQDDMQVVFQLPERFILRLKNPESNISIDDIVVSVKMEDEADYAHTAKIDYVANRVDPATGTVETRINLPNPDQLLRPGMFVRAILRLEEPVQSLLVPQAAVQVDQLGSYVLVVDDNNKVVRKNLDTDDRIGEKVVVLFGLKPGERVIVRGIQKARPGDTVKVLDFDLATDASGSRGQ